MEKFSTTTISDAFYKLKPPASTGGYIPDLSLVAGAQKLAGPVFPVKFAYKSADTAATKQHFVDACPSNSILLLCPPNDATNACLGGLLATAAAAKSIRGVVANGRVRDLDELEDCGLTVYAKGTSVCGQSPFLVPVQTGEPVDITHANGHTITIKAGDYLSADRNGVIVVDFGRLDEIQRIGSESESVDDFCRQALLKGAGVKETFAKYRGKSKL